MKCPECQFENRESEKFCKECGNKLELQCAVADLNTIRAAISATSVETDLIRSQFHRFILIPIPPF